MKAIFLYLLSALLFIPSTAFAQKADLFRVMFWNVENLFDCLHDSLKQDHEFLPQSLRGWHYGRYKKKLADVSRVITAVGEWSPPALVGLCEVENDKVLTDLTKYSSLKEHGYRYVMTNSADERGIDVALLYQRDKFKLLTYQSIVIGSSNKKFKPTRDILYATGMIITGDTLDIFVCHFPSRSSGVKESEPHRMHAAKRLRESVDSICSLRTIPRIIIMGDFNDYPQNKSISQVLSALSPSLYQAKDEPSRLYHLLVDKLKKKEYGSYKYRGEWGLLDHLIVSAPLLDSTSGFFTGKDQADVISLPFLLKEDEKYGGVQPFRTYHGMKYQGGYSDHLPVKVDFTIQSAWY